MTAEEFLCREENQTGLARTSRWTWQVACVFAEAYASSRAASAEKHPLLIRQPDGSVVTADYAALQRECVELKSKMREIMDEAFKPLLRADVKIERIQKMAVAVLSHKENL